MEDNLGYFQLIFVVVLICKFLLVYVSGFRGIGTGWKFGAPGFQFFGFSVFLHLPHIGCWKFELILEGLSMVVLIGEMLHGPLHAILLPGRQRERSVGIVGVMRRVG